MKKLITILLLFAPCYVFSVDYKNAVPSSGGTFTGNITAPNITATYGVSAATGTFIVGSNKLNLLGGNKVEFEVGDGYVDVLQQNNTLNFRVYQAQEMGITKDYAYITNNNFGISSATPQGLLTVGAGASLFRIASTGQIFANSLGAAGTGTAIVISATNELIPLTSSRRFKENIVPMKADSSKLSLLRPVEFDYKKGGGHAIGFIAEEVIKVYPQVVNKDKEGKSYSISYDQFIPILVDKIQKQQKKIENLEARIAKLEKLIK